MNREQQIKDNIRELKAIKKILAENLILSEVKYLEYLDEQKRLEDEIKQLKENNKEPKIEKIWIDIGDGWKLRVNKNE